MSSACVPPPAAAPPAAAARSPTTDATRFVARVVSFRSVRKFGRNMDVFAVFLDTDFAAFKESSPDGNADKNGRTTNSAGRMIDRPLESFYTLRTRLLAVYSTGRVDDNNNDHASDRAASRSAPIP